MAVKVAYFVHDAGDPAIRKRVAMLQAGGATVQIIAFRRAKAPVSDLCGAPVFDLGQTFDSRLGHRAGMVLRHVLLAAPFRDFVRGADIVLARNLEMLAIAARVRHWAAPGARLVYECLDIHPAMVGAGRKGAVLRAIERRLLGACSLLVVSSPAFIDAYFRPRQNLSTPVLLIENKVLALSPASVPKRPPRMGECPPWRIGWFGVIRAQKALDILARIVTANPGLAEVVIRGRPALVELADFHGQVARTPGLSFGGAYTQADLPGMYAGVDLCWAFDYFDESANSAWLLPNRLYEGGQFAAVPLAREGTETGQWLQRHGIGATFGDPAAEVGPWLRGLTQAGYATLAEASRAVPRGDIVADLNDCHALVDALAGRQAAGRPTAAAAA